MAAEKEVTLVIRARDRTRAAFRRLRGVISGLLADAGRLAGLLGAGLTAGAVALGRSAENLQNSSQLLGISATELQAAQRILARGGIRGLDEATDVLRDLSVRAAEARRETGEAREGFQRLGISAEDLDAGPIEVLGRLQQAVRELKGDLTDGEIAQALDQIGGDALVALLPALRRGGNITAEVRQIADSDTVRSNEAVARSAEISVQTQEELAIQLARLATVAENELPGLIRVLERALDVYDDLFPTGIADTAAGTGRTAVAQQSANIEAFANATEPFRRIPGSPLGSLATEGVIRVIERIEANTRNGPPLR